MNVESILTEDRISMLLTLGHQAVVVVCLLAVPLGLWLAITGVRKRKLLRAVLGGLLATGTSLVGLVGWALESGAFGCAYF